MKLDEIVDLHTAYLNPKIRSIDLFCDIWASGICGTPELFHWTAPAGDVSRYISFEEIRDEVSNFLKEHGVVRALHHTEQDKFEKFLQYAAKIKAMFKASSYSAEELLGGHGDEPKLVLGAHGRR